MRKFALFFTLMLCYIYDCYAQKTIALFNVSLDDNTGMPRWAELKQDQNISEKVFFEWFNETYQFSSGISFKLLRSDTDNIGFIHNRYKQYYNKAEVVNSMLIVHIKGRWVESFNGEYYKNFSENKVLISPSSARDKLLASYGNVLFRWQVPANESALKNVTGNLDATWYPNVIPLVYVLDKTSKKSHNVIPCYAIHVGISKPRQDVIVLLDVRNGDAVANFPQEVDTDSSGKANTFYEGIRNITTDFITKDSFRLQESGKRHVSTSKLAAGADFYDKDNYWNNGSDRIAADIHWAGELVSDFMKKYFQKNSYDGKGGTINMITSSGSGNAFWNLSSNTATFLVGSTTSVGPCAAVDVVGHEMGHGIADEICGLVYSGEACALHESFADINGHMTEITADSTKANWLIGEKVWSPGGIRNMRDPWKFSNPKAYGGKFWPNGCHGNGGVQNYWYYIMVNGDTATNEYGYVYKLAGLGHWKAAQIHYRGYFSYMVPNGTFKDALKGSIKAAKDLYGSCSNEIDYTFKAWKAVNVEDTTIKAVDLSHGINTATLLCSGIPVNSTLTCFGDISRSVFWTLDYKDTSSKKTFVYTFKTTGKHNIVLKTKTCGKTYYDSMKVTVNYKPDPKFSKPFDTACAGNNLNTFKNNTVNADVTLPLKYYWFINPGNTIDSTKDLKIAFPDGFDYEIQLKAYYQGGCWAIQKQNVNIIPKPHPSFEVLKNVCQGRTLRLKNTSDTNILPVKFTWQFPDATSFKGYVPTTKVLANSGIYSINLTADYLNGKCTDTANRVIEIYKNPILDIKYQNNCKNKIMTLIGSGNFASTKQNSQWHFGTYNPINKDTFLLQLTDSSSRTIGYTAYDARGCFSTAYKTINIGYAKALGTVSNACLGNLTMMSNTGAADATFVSKWEMGDGNTINSNSANYIYPKAGKFKVNLIVNTVSCADTQKIEALVWPLPNANFSAQSVCADKQSVFYNLTPNKNKLKHIWYFGDNDSSELSDPTHLYSIAKTTTYFVTLNSKDSNGCIGSITKPATINELPKCDYNVSLFQGNPAALTFKTVASNTGIYSWYFGDGDSSALSEPLHVFKTSGNYTTILKIKNANGCECFFSKSIASGTNGVKNQFPLTIKIYPNPTNSFLNIEYGNSISTNTTLIKASLVNTVSQILISEFIEVGHIKRWNVSEISKGIYFVKIDLKDQTYFQKIVIE